MDNYHCEIYCPNRDFTYKASECRVSTDCPMLQHIAALEAQVKQWEKRAEDYRSAWVAAEQSASDYAKKWNDAESRAEQAEAELAAAREDEAWNTKQFEGLEQIAAGLRLSLKQAEAERDALRVGLELYAWADEVSALAWAYSEYGYEKMPRQTEEGWEELEAMWELAGEQKRIARAVIAQGKPRAIHGMASEEECFWDCYGPAIETALERDQCSCSDIFGQCGRCASLSAVRSAREADGPVALAQGKPEKEQADRREWARKWDDPKPKKGGEV